MKKKKGKAWLIILAAIVVVGAIGAFAGKGEKNDPKPSESNQEAAATTAAQQTAEKTSDAVQPVETKSSETKEQATTPAATPPATTKSPEAQYTLADEVIVDNDFCKFTISKAEKTSLGGFRFKVLCENKTTDKTLMFSADDTSINGYTISALFAEKVAPGKKSNEEMSFSVTAMQEAGITSADEVVFSLRVYNYDNWREDDIVQETYTVYPTGMTADQIVYAERRKVEGEQVVLDNDQVTFIILETSKGITGSYIMKCYLENKTDKSLMFTWKDTSVNGFMMDPFWATTVPSGKREYSDISFSNSDLEKNDIKSIEEIEYTLHIYDSAHWMTGDVVNEQFVYKP